MIKLRNAREAWDLQQRLQALYDAGILPDLELVLWMDWRNDPEYQALYDADLEKRESEQPAPNTQPFFGIYFISGRSRSLCEFESGTCWAAHRTYQSALVEALRWSREWAERGEAHQYEVAPITAGVECYDQHSEEIVVAGPHTSLPADSETVTP